MKKITQVIFDLDGTLYEKKSVTDYALKKFSKEKNLDFNFVKSKALEAGEIIKREYKKFESSQQFFTEAYKIMLPLIGLDNSHGNLKYVEDLIEGAKQKILLDIHPRKGAINLLKFLKNSQIKLIVFSGGYPFYAIFDPEIKNKNYKIDLEFKKTQLNNLGLENYFDEIIPTSMFGGYKPEKKVFMGLLGYLKCKGEECFMIGDNENDIAAKQVGIKTILLGKEECKRYIPDYRAKNFHEIKEILSNYI